MLARFLEAPVSVYLILLVKNSLLVAVALLLANSAAADQGFTHIGDFDNVRSSDRGEHCSGYTVALWRHGDRVLGLFNVHSGVCGDAACAVIEDVQFNQRTRQLAFRSSVRSQNFTF